MKNEPVVESTACFEVTHCPAAAWKPKEAGSVEIEKLPVAICVEDIQEPFSGLAAGTLAGVDDDDRLESGGEV